jgi:hypothetical protein
MQREINTCLNKIKIKGNKFNELSIKYDSLTNENAMILNNLRENERVLGLEKERLFGL